MWEGLRELFTILSCIYIFSVYNFTVKFSLTKILVILPIGLVIVEKDASIVALLRDMENLMSWGMHLLDCFPFFVLLIYKHSPSFTFNLLCPPAHIKKMKPSNLLKKTLQEVIMKFVCHLKMMNPMQQSMTF